MVGGTGTVAIVARDGARVNALACVFMAAVTYTIQPEMCQAGSARRKAPLAIRRLLLSFSSSTHEVAPDGFTSTMVMLSTNAAVSSDNRHAQFANTQRVVSPHEVQQNTLRPFKGLD